MKLFTLLTILIAGSIAQAGVISGGGGKGVVCRDPMGNITSAQTLDLYEGRVLYNLQIQDYKEPVSTQVQNALDLIPRQSRVYIEPYAFNVQKNMQIVRGMDLQPIDDALVVAVPRGCKAEQLANYFDDKHILVNGDIWDALSNTDKSALILHEAVYRAARILGAKNSQRTRHVVASLFDPNTKWIDLEEALPKDKLICSTPGFYFYAYQDVNKQWQIQFTVLGGNWLMSKTTYSGFSSTFDFNETKTFPISKGDDKIGTKVWSAGYSRSNFEDSDILTFTKKWEAIKDIQGNIIPGFQQPKYYISWLSSTYPETSMDEQLINCSIVIH